MFIHTLFIIVIKYKHHTCPSTDEEIIKQWSIYTMEYSDILKSGITKFISNIDGVRQSFWGNIDPEK